MDNDLANLFIKLGKAVVEATFCKFNNDPKCIDPDFKNYEVREK